MIHAAPALSAGRARAQRRQRAAQSTAARGIMAAAGIRYRKLVPELVGRATDCVGHSFVNPHTVNPFSKALK